MGEIIKLNAGAFSEIEYETAETILREIAFGETDRHDSVPSCMEGKSADEHFNGSCVAHPQFKRCSFRGARFDGINGIASNILDCQFRKAEFKDAGMAFSDFSGTHFMEGTTFINCGCSESNFLDVYFSDVFAEGSAFDRSFFINAAFQNTEFCHCSFEDTVFQKASFKNCNLIHANLEYADLQDCRLEQVNFPFWGALRSFGGLQAIKSSHNSTVQYADRSKLLSTVQFLERLPSIQPYFAKKHEYFPLANINIFLGNQQEALYYIMLGLKDSLEQRNFRMVRYLCKLASHNHFFTSKELRQLYEALVTNSQISCMNNHQYQLYLRELTEIKQLLVDNPFNMPQMVLTCTTALDPQDYQGLTDLLCLFEQTLHRELPQCSYYYSVRHNSPPTLEYFISDILPNLYQFASVISIALLGFSQSVAALQNVLTKHAENKYNTKTLDERARQEKLKNDLLEEQIRNQKLMNAKLESDIKSQKEKEASPATKPCDPKQLQGKIKAIHFTMQSSDPNSVPVREHTFTPS